MGLLGPWSKGAYLSLSSSSREGQAQTGRRVGPPCLRYRPLLQEYNQAPPGLQSSGVSTQIADGQILVWIAVSVLNLKTQTWDFAVQVLGPNWEEPPFPSPHSRDYDLENAIQATARDHFSRPVKVSLLIITRRLSLLATTSPWVR